MALNPTPEELTFAAAYLKSSNPGSAAAAVRPDLKIEELAQYGKSLLKRTVVKRVIRAALVEQGAMAKAVASTIEQLYATAPNGETPLWGVRDKAAERIFRAAGAYDEEIVQITAPGNEAINITPKTPEDIELLRQVVNSNGKLPNSPTGEPARETAPPDSSPTTSSV